MQVSRPSHRGLRCITDYTGQSQAEVWALLSTDSSTRCGAVNSAVFALIVSVSNRPRSTLHRAQKINARLPETN